MQVMTSFLLSSPSCPVLSSLTGSIAGWFQTMLQRRRSAGAF
jgi:hypothetical protein